MFFALRFSLPYNIGCCSALGLAKRNGSNNSKAEMFCQNRIGIAAPPISSPSHFTRLVVSLDGFLICCHRFLIKNCTKEGGKK